MLMMMRCAIDACIEGQTIVCIWPVNKIGIKTP